MIAFILPPLPSLWAVALLAIAYGLYKTDHSILGTASAGLGVVMLFGWFMSLLSWGVSMLLVFVVVALLGFLAMEVVKKTFKKKSKDKTKKSINKTQPKELNQNQEIFDINSILASNNELLSKIEKDNK